jgi:Site-specific recombinases, DNA invertase Pin homologs
MGVKKVRCLYRVSTLKQLDENDKQKNDIPMQRIVCSEFIDKMPEWKLDKEYIEQGVSGYNKKLEERDVLQEIKQDALNKEFDVLLVFMFDRLGRREDETPFVVEWFVNQGIEIWSTQEGQQKFDTRADKLINYIRYWQSGGESEKTSIRVKTKQKQMVEEGINITSVPPYGYKLVKSGVFSKRGVERKTYEIIPTEAEIVKTIFNLFTESGYGGMRIAKYLNEKGCKTHKGYQWSYSTINNMLKNPIYIGHLSYNKTTVPIRWR